MKFSAARLIMRAIQSSRAQRTTHAESGNAKKKKRPQQPTHSSFLPRSVKKNSFS